MDLAQPVRCWLQHAGNQTAPTDRGDLYDDQLETSEGIIGHRLLKYGTLGFGAPNRSDTPLLVVDGPGTTRGV